MSNKCTPNSTASTTSTENKILKIIITLQHYCYNDYVLTGFVAIETYMESIKLWMNSEQTVLRQNSRVTYLQ